MPLVVAKTFKTLPLITFVAVIVFMKVLDLEEEHKRRIKKALFELNELPRRVLI